MSQVQLAFAQASASQPRILLSVFADCQVEPAIRRQRHRISSPGHIAAYREGLQAASRFLQVPINEFSLAKSPRAQVTL